MLKKSLFSPAQPRRAETRLSPGGGLASLRGSTYRTECASPLRLLPPCWADFFSILLRHLRLFQIWHSSFPQPGNVLAPGVLGRLRLSR
jgi:hypothetical protein